jgi:tetratricopeptide (TPR) repeat protein
VYKKQLREHDSYIGMASSSLGDLYYKKGDYLTAKKYYEEACQVYLTEYYANSPDHDYIKDTKEKLKDVEEKLLGKCNINV